MASLFDHLLSQGWHCRPTGKHRAIDQFDSGYIIYKRYGKEVHTLDFLEDGVSLYTVFEHEISYGHIGELSADDINVRKGRATRQLLGPGAIRTDISSLIEFVSRSCWESSALFCNEASIPDYVFSSYLLRVSTGDLRTETTERILLGLLEPRHSYEISLKPLNEMAGSDEASIDAIRTMLANAELDDLPFQRMYFSWSSAVLAGEYDFNSLSMFVRMVKESQAAWIYAHALESSLDRVLDEAQRGCGRRSVFDIMARANRISAASRQYTSITSGRFTRYEVRAKKVIFRNSLLNEIVANIHAKAQATREIMVTARDDRIRESQRWIQFAVLVMATLQGFSAYITVVTTHTETPFEVYAGFGLLLAIGAVAIFSRHR